MASLFFELMSQLDSAAVTLLQFAKGLKIGLKENSEEQREARTRREA